MNRYVYATFLCFAAATGHAAAQIQVPINPRATFLGIANDPSAVPASGIPLSALGLSPGVWVEIATVGAYSANSGPDTTRNLIAVFSTSPQLLTPANGLVQRVPGAVPIVHGAPIATRNTQSQNRPTDIAEDFVVCRASWSNGATIQVPAGAAYVFFSVFNPSGSNHFSNYSDPNADFFAVLTPSSPAVLQGTAEHCELRTGVNGTPTVSPDLKQAAAFTTLSVEVAQRFGESTGELFAIAANAYATNGAPPVGPLPDIHMGQSPVVVQIGTMASAPALWSFFVPPGNAGTTLVVQGFFLAPNAQNGIVSASNAHRIELQ
ncbi:MAG: hypothetical protein KDE27_30770 [Planctomycetes bacterium]|nr:hypothetical protein [Planctomycetota bacterium]